ncbi:hypothetical protein AALP_AAs55560U001200 [Arabis alpina]|uniref:Cystatin domain-containing protein n=1 Tax=Arabis alpina TaxID=50452 RepID=A0A087G3Q8_ARAAL|nr:hypothetical protein AALP_AAs55560U001200 [Arabis alpina]
MEMLIKTAIDEENEETRVSKGFFFKITFWAKDVSTPNQEPKLYQAKVRKFGDEILVFEFRLRPTQ